MEMQGAGNSSSSNFTGLFGSHSVLPVATLPSLEMAQMSPAHTFCAGFCLPPRRK